MSFSKTVSHFFTTTMATYKVFATMTGSGGQRQTYYNVQADESYLKSITANGRDREYLASMVQQTYPETRKYDHIRISEYKKV